MACTGIHALDPICHAKQIIGDVGDDAFSKVCEDFGRAAASATDWLWRQMDSATSLDLASGGVRNDLLVTGAIAGVLSVGLFLIQVIISVLRREPGGLTRGLRGLVVATLGAAFAVAVTRVVLTVVDQVAAGVVRMTMGQNIDGLGRRFAIGAGLGGLTNPVVLLVVSLGVLVAVVFVWAALMTRKTLLIVSAVFTPIAFAGGTADITRAWVRRWIEFTAALIASKLVLVLILMIGLSVFDGAGQRGTGAPQTATQLVSGVLILMLGGFAPWLALKMVHFVGDSFQAVHVHGKLVHAGAQTAIALPQKAARIGAMTGLGSIAKSAYRGPSVANSSTPSKPQAPPPNEAAAAPASSPVSSAGANGGGK